MKGIYNWVGKYANSKYGDLILGFLVSIEGFLPIPSSAILAFYCLQNRRRYLIYALITTLTSVLAAFIGYTIGSLFWDVLGQKMVQFISEAKFIRLTELYKTYQGATIFAVSLAPFIPFKLLTLTAGFCKLPILKFLLYTLIARGIKFYAIALSIHFWGDRVNYLLNKYFYYIIVLAIVLLISFISVEWMLFH